MARFTGASGSGSGAPGPRGPQGPEGDSAYEVAVANGFTGTEQEWLDSFGGTADIADFIFTSEEGQSIVSLPGDKQMRIQAGEESDLYLDAGDDLYITAINDDIHIRANDDIRFISNYINGEENEHYWRMDSEGRLQLPGDGYISNPYQETTTPSTYATSFNDNYLNDQSGLTQANGVYLIVDSNTLWFANNGNTFTSPVTITFADSTAVQTVAIYDATSQGTPAVVFQWDGQIDKTYADTFPLLVSVDYNQINYGPSVIELDPQWIGNDQKLVIDATAPNHIHIRAGGEIDQSTADLILGGEENNVMISDTQDSVSVNSTGTINLSSTIGPINIGVMSSPGSVNITSYSGVTLNSVRTGNYSDENKVVAVLGDIPETFDPLNIASNIVPSQDDTYSLGTAEKRWKEIHIGEGTLYITDSTLGTDAGISVDNGVLLIDGVNQLQAPDIKIDSVTFIDNTVQTTAYLGNGAGNNGEVTRYSPNFKATGLTFTGTGATYPTYNSHYVKNGRMVSFFVEIDLATVTNFGTGQYIAELPFMPLTGTMNHFQAWALVDPAVNPDVAGHVVLQADHLANTKDLDLHYLKQAGGAHTPLMEGMFVQGTPVTLTTSSKIYINGTYITAE